MRFHPAVLMLIVWAGIISAFYVLPFRLESRTLTLYGVLILAAFIGTFCLGAFLAGRPMQMRARNRNVVLDFRLVDRVLLIGCGIAVLALLWDIQDRNVLNLAEAFQHRNDTATALLRGGESESSIAFQLGFLTYPAAYAWAVRHILFARRPSPLRLGLIGLLPVVLVSLAMGGRAPLFYAILIMGLAFALRRTVFGKTPSRLWMPQRRKPARIRISPAQKIGLVIAGVASMAYFIRVFIARADVVGGVEAMFGVAELNWGVSFNGALSSILYSGFGAEFTYIVFIFSWYSVQGYVISNEIFTDYNGPMLLGTYGIDLASALIRRLNGDFVAAGFGDLLKMNVYGFLPSAWGSLYVDFHFFGLLFCLLWGWLAGLVYNRVQRGQDPRWLLLAPFATLGILTSLANTPIGFSNGLTTHIWIAIVFLLVRRRTQGMMPAPKVSREGST